MNRLLFLLLIATPLLSKSEFIQVNQVDSTKLIDSRGEEFIIRGISFGNSVWMNPESPELIDHHTARDYIRVKELGFNSVRFYINYALFEDDSRPYEYKEEGFRWLDQNIKWAKDAGILLLINMHFPPGGFQSMGDGDSLWTDKSKERRLAKLWEEIGRRYRDEETILGYGILNEPIPVNGLSQWSSLANNVIKHIRRGDKYHLIFVERALYSKSGVSKEELKSHLFPDVRDKGPLQNLVYEFHFYSPIEFTHQNASWLPDLKGEYSSYPDESRLIIEDLKWIWFSNNAINFDGSDHWKEISNDIVYIDSDNHKIGKAVVQVSKIGDSIVYFDDIRVDEFDSKGNFLGTVFNSSVDRIGEWYFWSENGEGYRGASANKGSSNNRSILIKNTTSDANLTSKSSFFLKKGNGYKISGRLKGNIHEDGLFRLRIDYYNSDSDIESWNKEFLENSIKEYVDFSRDINSPIYLGEFGLIRDSFNSGGYEYLEDLFEVLNRYKVNYNYHTYNEYNFGFKYENKEDSRLAKIFLDSNR